MMTCLSLLWPNVWIITVIAICLNCIVNNCAKPCATDSIQDDLARRTAWIDEKGLLKFHSSEAYPNKCESCSEPTEGSEVCYTADSVERAEDTSMCVWAQTVADEPSFETYTLRKFPIVAGLKVLSVTKYKIEQWLNIDETFDGLTDLEYLYLESNHIIGWDISNKSETQEPLTNLRVLSLANNPIAYLSSNSFSWLKGSKLEYLNLRGCSNMKILDSAVFEPLANSNELWLDLSYTIIDPEQLPDLLSGFQHGQNQRTDNKGLTVLSLAHAGLNRIPTAALEKIAHSLEMLSLQGNYFSNCRSTSINGNGDEGDCVLPEMNNLKEINLKDSGITDFPFEIILKATQNLEALYLDENPLEEMSCNKASNISYISLKNIRNDKGFLLRASESICSFPKLKSLDLSNTLLNITLSDFSSFKSLQNLSLCNSVTENFTGLLKSLSNLEVLDISHNNLRDYLDTESFKGLNNLKELRMQSCSIQKIAVQQFTHLKKLTVLDMRNNFLRELGVCLFDGLENLQKLILHENRIGSWKQPVFSTDLQTLDLRSNWLSDITSAMQSDFKRIAEIDISYNPLSCDCSMLQFVNTFINNKRNVIASNENEDFQFTLLNWDEPMAYMCLSEDNNQREISKLNIEDICKTTPSTTTPTTTVRTTTVPTTTVPTTTIENIIPDTSSISSTTDSINSTDTLLYTNSTSLLYVYIIIGIIPLGGVLCYWKRRNIIMFLHIFRRNMVLSLLKDNKTKEGKKDSYQYDVFLSYSDRDREWILKQLIPNLEQRGNIKVCLHERDFEAGLPVLENIMACMDHSRCVLLVLSEAFLRSHWCQFELNLAQHRLLEMQHDRLILVLLENIPRDKCSKMLRYLMLTKTYLFWPDKGDDEEKCLFWRKLKKAIGPVHDTVNVSFV